MTKQYIERFRELTEPERVLVNEPMAKHTTFRVGGPAECLIEIQSAEEIRAIIEVCQKEEIPWFVIGRGSNLLVSDSGFGGVILAVNRYFRAIQEETDVCFRVQAGAMLSAIAAKALECSLTGMEFAAGIPGTLGGAVVMNAGAYGGEMKDIVKEVTLLDETGRIFRLSGEEMEFGYRKSILQKKPYIVLEALLCLEKGDPAAIREKMQSLKQQRCEKQPLEYPSAGSAFKRPEGYFAAKLIMDAGLRGFCVGDAQVSEKHCGFVINKGNATAAQVRELLWQVQQKVKELYGITLEPEIRFLGNFDSV